MRLSGWGRQTAALRATLCCTALAAAEDGIADAAPLKYLSSRVSAEPSAAAAQQLTEAAGPAMVYIAESGIPGAGRGVFAGKSFLPGEVVDRSHYVDMPRTEAATSGTVGRYVFKSTVDPSRSLLLLGFGSLFNHGGDGANVVYRHSEGEVPGPPWCWHLPVEFLARRPIAAGEELLIDYGYEPSEYAHNATEMEGMNSICGELAQFLRHPHSTPIFAPSSLDTSP
jgi:hypothetical protein